MKTYDIIIITTYLLYTRNGRFFSIALYTRLYQIKENYNSLDFRLQGKKWMTLIFVCCALSWSVREDELCFSLTI